MISTLRAKTTQQLKQISILNFNKLNINISDI